MPNTSLSKLSASATFSCIHTCTCIFPFAYWLTDYHSDINKCCLRMKAQLNGLKDGNSSLRWMYLMAQPWQTQSRSQVSMHTLEMQSVANHDFEKQKLSTVGCKGNIHIFNWQKIIYYGYVSSSVWYLSYFFCQITQAESNWNLAESAINKGNYIYFILFEFNSYY